MNQIYKFKNSESYFVNPPLDNPSINDLINNGDLIFLFNTNILIETGLWVINDS